MEDGIPRLRRSNSKSSLLTLGEKATSQRLVTTGFSIAAFILGLLGCALALGLGIGYGRGNSGDIQNLRDTVDQMQLNMTVQSQILHSELMLLRAQFVDGLMNVSGGGAGYTTVHVQNGTFKWKDDFGQVVPSTYSNDVIVFGPLSFQLLTIYPPSTPLIIDPMSGGLYNFYLGNFDPFVSQLILEGPIEAFIPLTSTNAAKINVTNDQDCFKSPLAPFPTPMRKRVVSTIPFCYEASQLGLYSEPSRNSLYAHFSSGGSNFFFGGTIVYPVPILDGQGFTLTAPWQLVLAAF